MWEGRVGKGHGGAGFWSHRNVLSLDWSEGYTDASVDQNSSDCTLKIHFVVCKLSLKRK